MMAMYFNTLTDLSDILFYGWNTNSWTGVLIASIIICAITIIFEALKAVKSSLVIYIKSPASNQQHDDQHDQVYEVSSSQAELLSSLRIPFSTEHSRVRKTVLFLIESVLHMFNFLYGYILMLLVMTYSVWFLLAILLGSGVGFFIFHPLGQHFISQYIPKRPTRSCHGETESLLQPQRNYQSISQYAN